MKRAIALIIIGICLFIGASFIGGTPGSASGGDTGWTCPPGTTYSYKIDNLSGPTFTVPSAPDGWVVLGVSIKAGPDHYDYPTAQSGDIINVKSDTGHDTSHAHICKRKQWESTTTTPTTSTTSTTTSTSSPPRTTSTTTNPSTTNPSATTTTSTSTSVTETSTTSTTEVVSITTNPAPTTSVQESTSTSIPKSTTVPSWTPSTSSPAPDTNPSSSTTLPSQPTVTSEPGTTTVQPPGPFLPATGGTLNIIVLALILLSAGIIMFVWTWRE